jgi:ribosomal protein S1
MPRKKAEPESVQASENPAGTAAGTAAAEPEAKAPPAPARERRRPAFDGNILYLSDEEIGITAEDSEDAKWNYLAGAARREQILTGTVSSVIPSEAGTPACAVDFEGMRVLIPFREMVLQEWPEAEIEPQPIRSLMERMLGATVDFLPVGVDVRNRAAVGSRKAAMLLRQKQYYDRGRVKPGILVSCRVLSVTSFVMTVEAIGVDSEIPARNISWGWFSEIGDLHSTGELVVAKVMDVKRDETTGRYSVDLSIKDATENSDKTAFMKLIPNSNYFGVVTGVNDGTFYVRLQCGVNARTRIYRSSEYPSKMDTVSFKVARLDEEHMIAHGLITRIIKRHTRLR